MLASNVRVGMCLPSDYDSEILEMVTAREVTDSGLIRLYLGPNTYVAVDPTDEVDARNISGDPL